MTNVVIQKGTPRESRNVTEDKAWLEERIEHLKAKKEIFSERGKKVTKELKIREKQLASL